MIRSQTIRLPAKVSPVSTLRTLSLASVVLLSACQSFPLPSLTAPKVSEAPAAATTDVAAPSQVAATPASAEVAVAEVARLQTPQPTTDHRYAVQPAGFSQPGGTNTLPATAWTGDAETAERYYGRGSIPGNYSNYCQPAQPGYRAGNGCSHGGCACCGGGNYGNFQFSDSATALPWKPPGIGGPWPHDEYVCDGGDLNADVRVKANWDVVGLDKEDTVAHYDTLDGKTEVAASNPVCIYAPRFAAVRKVASPIVHEGHERMAGVEKPTRLGLHNELTIATNVNQPLQPLADLALDGSVTFREQTRGLGVENTLMPVLTRREAVLHEDLQMIQRGVFQADEKARLAEGVQAALVWTSNQAVQIIIDGEMAAEGRGVATAQETVVYELLGKPRLRICKVASNSDARVGEFVDFTLRFDNVGDQKIGNVTIIDHVTTRLEYVAGSQQSTLKSNFIAIENVDSTILRWEITDPLEVNEGGVVRFRAKVR